MLGHLYISTSIWVLGTRNSGWNGTYYISLFQLAIGVCNTQTLVEIYNRHCTLTYLYDYILIYCWISNLGTVFNTALRCKKCYRIGPSQELRTFWAGPKSHVIRVKNKLKKSRPSLTTQLPKYRPRQGINSFTQV